MSDIEHREVDQIGRFTHGRHFARTTLWWNNGTGVSAEELETSINATRRHASFKRYATTVRHPGRAYCPASSAGRRVLGVHHSVAPAELDYELATSDYFRSTKMDSQSSGPTFSAECDGVIGTACAVPALLTISIVLSSGG